jgi:homoserine kinase type II
MLGEFLGKPAILYPFVEGENACAGEVDREQAITQTATTIARLHEVTAELVLPYPRVHSGTDSRRMLRGLLEHIRQRGVAAHEPALRTLVEQAECRLREFEERLASPAADLPRGVVHHDAHCANVLFRDGRLVALIDFDDACEGYLVADLAVMIANWAATFGGDDALDLSRAALVLRAYERQRRLTAGERDLLPDFVLLFLLGDTSAYVQGRLEQGADGDQAVHDCNVYRRYVHHAHDAAWADALRRCF